VVNLNDPENDGQSPNEEYWVIASFVDDEGMIQEEQIGKVTLSKDIAQNDMPFELEINGVVYKRED